MENEQNSLGLLIKIKRQLSAFPILNLIIWACLWGILILFCQNVLLQTSLDIPKWFPISVFYGPRFSLPGVPYAIAFLIILGFTIWKIDEISDFIVCLIGSSLIVLGNMIQGSFYKAFISPFVAMHNQYYYDAVHVDNWIDWLAHFNANQLTLADHSQTHPPFAVLIQKLFLSISGNEVAGLAIFFAVISMASIFLMIYVLKVFGVEGKQRKLLLLLFSVIPAINIYSIACLDAVILTTSTLFLLGIGIILKRPQQKLWGSCVLAVGLITTSLLTFSSLFLVGVGLLLAAYEFLVNKKTDLLYGMLGAIILFGIIMLVLKFGFHYNHIVGFLTSMKHEHMAGKSITNTFLNYFVTRIEDVFEILVFLSLGVLSVVFPLKKKNWRTNNIYLIVISAVIVILATFLSGTFRTGETARSCLFIFPFLLLLLTEEEPRMLKYMTILAGVQTVLMQILGGYFW